MRNIKLILKSLLYYRKTNVALILSTALCVTIISGALIIGDSIDYSLKELASSRLGKAKFAMVTGSRFVRNQLADDLAQKLNTAVYPVLQLKGIVSADGGEKRINNVHVNGVGSDFWNLGSPDPGLSLGPDEIILNRKTAEKLGVEKGDECLVKIEKVSQISLENPFVSDKKTFVTLRATVKYVLPDDMLGRFSIKTDQIVPYNVFVSIDYLNEKMDLQGNANLLLAEDNSSALKTSTLNEKLREVWLPDDAGLTLKELPDQHQIELLSDQVFVSRNIEKLAGDVGVKTYPLITYLVNNISFKNNSIPYSFVSGSNDEFIHKNLSENGVILNRWAAEDLGAGIGDTVTMDYFTFGPLRILEEKAYSFVVEGITEIEGFAADKDLMPSYPGMTDVDNCRDWDAGIAIDLDKIRDKDEDYWDMYKGTPKAFINLNTAQKLWENRYGRLTAIRFADDIPIKDLAEKLKENIDPSTLGYAFKDASSEGFKAAENGVDFSQLFIGLSFFVLLSSLLLIAMLFYNSIETRTEEIGLYRAVGIGPGQIRYWLLAEGVLIAFTGSVLGITGGIFYNKIMLEAVNSIWFDIVRTSILHIKILPGTVIMGFAIGMLLSVATMYLSIRKKMLFSIVDLQKNSPEHKMTVPRRSSGINKWLVISGIVLIVVIVGLRLAEIRMSDTMMYFVLASLLMVIGISGYNLFLNTGKTGASGLDLFIMVKRNILLNRSRYMQIVIMFTVGVFLVLSTGANRQYLLFSSSDKTSGTGGAMFYATTSIPVVYDLNNPEIRSKFSLDTETTNDLHFLQCKMLEGDEASCLNLNRVYHPRVLGIDGDYLDQQGMFSFAGTVDGVDPEHPWRSLNRESGKNTYPAIADQTVITWSLGMKLGDTLTYQSDKGDTVNFVLVGGLQNSIFQGNLLISDSLFSVLFPSVAGTRVQLIEGDMARKDTIQQIMERNFADYGIDMTYAPDRLAEFYSVQNTYLSIFMALGGLGLILATAGLAIIIFRNVRERKKELSFLQAIGFRDRSIRNMLIWEHLMPFFAGIICGTIAAVVSTLPSFISSNAGVPVVLILIIIAGLVLSGILWIMAATRISLKGNIALALKES